MNTNKNTPPTGTVAQRLAELQQRARQAASARLVAGPTPRIVGASKSQPAFVLEEAMAAGLRHFGENKVQEAQSKWPALKAAHPDMALHLIGSLQSNKAADAVALFDVIETIDRIKIADEVAEEMAKQSRSLTLLFLLIIGV